MLKILNWYLHCQNKRILENLPRSGKYCRICLQWDSNPWQAWQKFSTAQGYRELLLVLSKPCSFFTMPVNPGVPESNKLLLRTNRAEAKCSILLWIGLKNSFRLLCETIGKKQQRFLTCLVWATAREWGPWAQCFCGKILAETQGRGRANSPRVLLCYICFVLLGNLRARPNLEDLHLTMDSPSSHGRHTVHVHRKSFFFRNWVWVAAWSKHNHKLVIFDLLRATDAAKVIMTSNCTGVWLRRHQK